MLLIFCFNSQFFFVVFVVAVIAVAVVVFAFNFFFDMYLKRWASEYTGSLAFFVAHMNCFVFFFLRIFFSFFVSPFCVLCVYVFFLFSTVHRTCRCERHRPWFTIPDKNLFLSAHPPLNVRFMQLFSIGYLFSTSINIVSFFSVCHSTVILLRLHFNISISCIIAYCFMVNQ